MKKTLYSSDYGIEPNGLTDVTGKLQQLIDDAGASEGKAVVQRGIYLN